jgi:hypothetical protein
MKIPNRYVAKRISFDPEISLQIFLCGVTQHNRPSDCEQNRPMKNDQECKANNQAGHHAAPKPPPVTPRLCLIVLGHRAILLPVWPGAKRKCRDQLQRRSN